VVLALTFVLLVSALALALWGTTRFFQSYLYSEPADKLPVRALVAGLVVGGFMTLWTYVNTRADSENKYGTFFDFNPEASKEVAAFEAVRRHPKRDERGKFLPEGEERTVAFTRKPGGKAGEFVDEKTGAAFELKNTSQNYLTVALVLDDGDGRKARFNAAIDPKNPNTYATAGDAANHRFDEERGSRYIDGAFPATVYAPSRAIVFAALGLNALAFVAWFAAFWPVLRYGSGHALGMATACGLVTMLVLMPLLFKLNKPKPAVVLPPGVTAPQ
jgi:hypothetical protein